jgi:protein TonB
VDTTSVPPPVVTPRGGDVVAPAPVVVEPRIDARRGLSEPMYPPSEIREQHEGTVLLSVLVLPNGRVGDVRIDRSSGYPKLDESARREARQWRLTPGTRDGQPVQMWKQIPISFQLKD